jgi:hypothetical protein
LVVVAWRVVAVVAVFVDTFATVIRATVITAMVLVSPPLSSHTS